MQRAKQLLTCIISHLHISHSAPYLPPIKFGIRIIFNFSWEGGNENEKAMQNFGGQIKCIMEDGKWRIQQMCPKKIDNNYPVLKRVLSVAF